MKRRFDPPLNKRLVAERDGYTFYSVSAFAVRNSAEPDEEFDNFADHEDFPDLIEKDEVWVSNLVVRREGEFFIADALARLKEREKGSSEDRAYTVGLNAER